MRLTVDNLSAYNAGAVMLYLKGNTLITKNRSALTISGNTIDYTVKDAEKASLGDGAVYVQVKCGSLSTEIVKVKASDVNGIIQKPLALAKDIDSQLGQLQARYINFNNASKYRISSLISSSSGTYSRRAYLLFSAAGGVLWCVLMKVSLENGTPTATYVNIAGDVVTKAEAEVVDGYVTGVFTMKSARWDGAMILGHEAFTVSRV